MIIMLLFQQFKGKWKTLRLCMDLTIKRRGSPRASANGADDAGHYEVVQSDAAVDQEYEMLEPADKE